jgi:hypothetical protein
MIEFPSAAADRAVLAALEEDAAACDLTTQWSVPDGGQRVCCRLWSEIPEGHREDHR